MLRIALFIVLLHLGAGGPVHGQGRGGNVHLKKLITRFRTLGGRGTGIAAPKRLRVELLTDIAATRDEQAVQFLAGLVRSPRHADLMDDLMRLLAKAGPGSAIAATVFREHLDTDDPYRRLAREFLLERAVRRGDDAWLTGFFAGRSIIEDRFLALGALGRIGSPSTLRGAWSLLRDRTWKPQPGSPVTCGTIALSVRGFEGPNAARLLLLLERDPRFAEDDRWALRGATRLWATGNLRSYVKLSDLAQADAGKRAESARFMGDAGIEAARAPLLMMARNALELPDVRAAAAEALGGLKIARADLARKLVALLEDAEPIVREGAVAGLGRLRIRQAAAALVALLGTPLEKEARAALSVAHGKPRGHDWKAWLPACMLPDGT